MASRLALDAGNRVVRNGKAEAAAVSEATMTAGRAAATTTGPFGARVALDAVDGVGAPCPLHGFQAGGGLESQASVLSGTQIGLPSRYSGFAFT
jgi:hypothetical protein